MSYQFSWTKQNAQGEVEPASDYISKQEIIEIAEALNRRRKLAFIEPLTPYDTPKIAGYNLSRLETQLSTIVGIATFTGTPLDEKPFKRSWLNPTPGTDYNKEITLVPKADSVIIYNLINGTGNFSRHNNNEKFARATHINELRKAVKILSKGCWQSTLGFLTGISSAEPNSQFYYPAIHKSDSMEVRSIARTPIKSGNDLGLKNVTVTDESSIMLTADCDCQIAIYHCLRPADLTSNQATWTSYNSQTNSNWSQPGGLGAGDAELIGTLNLQAYQAGTLSGAAVKNTLQKMVDGAPANFIAARTDTGNEFISLSGCVNTVWEINTPPA